MQSPAAGDFMAGALTDAVTVGKRLGGREGESSALALDALGGSSDCVSMLRLTHVFSEELASAIA